MKALLIAVGVAVAVALVVVILWTTSADLLVARAIEHYGSEALGTSVNVGAVKLDTRAGRGTIEGLRVAQPEGFGYGDAITVQEITLDIDAASLLGGDPYGVELVRVAMPRVFFVMKADYTNNLAVIQENVARRSAGEDPAPATRPGEEPESRLRIDRLEFEGGRIAADMSEIGLGNANASLPPVRANDLGGVAGAPPGEIATAIARLFVAHTVRTITASTVGRKLDQLLDEDSGEVRNLLDTLFPR